MHNYFKVGSDFVFFDDARIVDVEEAFQDALELAGKNTSKISMLRIPHVSGPWDAAALIGYRTRVAILSDMAAAKNDPVEISMLREELRALDLVYYEAGRHNVPAALVAA